jgi:hypothetical protein
MTGILGAMEAMGVNFTAWTMHPRGGPSLITDWNNFTPNSCSGQFVYNRLLSYGDPAHASTLLNKGFEAPVVTTYSYLPTGSSWTFAGNAGIQKTWGAAISGSQTAFLQTAAAIDAGHGTTNGSMSQTINFAATGCYTVSYLQAVRSGKAGLPVAISVDGVRISSVAHEPTQVTGSNSFSPTTSAPFVINTTGNHTIKLEAVNSPGLDREVLVDNVTVAATAPAWMTDQGFQYPDLKALTGAPVFVYRPAGQPWAYTGNAGVYRAGWTGGATPPEGSGPKSTSAPQAAFLQTAAALDVGHQTIDGTITDDIEFATPGAYAIRFRAALRTGTAYGALPIIVSVDGTPVSTITPTSTTYAYYTTAAFAIEDPGYHTVQFAASPSAGLDKEALIDDLLVTVPVAAVARPIPVAVGDAGFEMSSPAFGHGKQPTGTAWTFTGITADPFYAGIQSDGSSYASYDAKHSAEGWQTAFLFSNGTIPATISQVVNFPAAGNYSINFQAQKGRGGAEPLTVKVDGTSVGTHTPTHKAFYPYTTMPFPVTAGNHTITIAGGLVTGTYLWSLVDAVNVWQGSVDPGANTAFVTGQTLGTLRNNATSWLGMKITVGAAPITVKELGRWVVAGNTATHSVEIVNSTGVVLGTVSVNAAGGSPGFRYATLATPVTLDAGAVYFVASQEISGGDQFYDCNTVLTTTTAATVNSGAFANNGRNFTLNGGGPRCYVPVDFKY